MHHTAGGGTSTSDLASSKKSLLQRGGGGIINRATAGIHGMATGLRNLTNAKSLSKQQVVLARRRLCHEK